MNEIAKKITSCMTKCGLSLRDVERMTGIKRSALNKYTTGKTEKIPLHVIEKLAPLFDVPAEWLIGWDEQEPRGEWVRIPVYGKVAAGTPIYADEDVEDYVEIPYSLAKTGEFTGLRIHGHSMEPEIKDNDIVVVKLQEEAENGDIVIAFVGNEEATCKRFKATDSGIMLVPINTAFDPLAFTRSQMREMPVKIYGKVVSCMRYY